MIRFITHSFINLILSHSNSIQLVHLTLFVHGVFDIYHHYIVVGDLLALAFLIVLALIQ